MIRCKMVRGSVNAQTNTTGNDDDHWGRHNQNLINTQTNIIPECTSVQIKHFRQSVIIIRNTHSERDETTG